MHQSLLHRHTCMCGMAAVAVLMSFQARAQQPASTNTTQTRIACIQNGLLPSVVIKGQPLPAMKLADRMQYYRVPGVSIAFFDDGQIVWSQSYGVADKQTGRPVTPETLFQAGSISKPIASLGALRLVESGKLKLDENVWFTLHDGGVRGNE
jgi:CubicO group peptidase (beta-lactamase class C family)